MKKIILIFLVAAVMKNAKAQTPVVHDTLAYLQSIVANKAQFVGQPFSRLMDSLKIQIRFYFPFASLPYNRYKETSTSYAFYFPPTFEEIYLTYPHLEIVWQSPFNAEQSSLLRSQYRSVGWNTQLANHYSSGIIADIKLIE